jgi:hypothetical protein
LKLTLHPKISAAVAATAVAAAKKSKLEKKIYK